MKMKAIYGAAVWLALAGAGVLATGCDGRSHRADHGYEVTLRLADSLRCDSVTMHVVDEIYGAQRQYGCRRRADGTISFSGQTTGQHVAFMTLDTLATPFYFVLEPGQTSITLARHRWSIAGGRGNADYVQFASLRVRLLAERERTLAAYRQAAADSTLTLRGERQAAMADSLLADSLQRLMLHTMQRRDAVGRIARERFIGTLAPATLQQLQSSMQ